MAFLSIKRIYLMHKIILLIFLLFCTQVHAGVEKLKVENEIVYFTTPNKNPTLTPSCVNSDNVLKWAFSLNSINGRHLFRAVLMAQSSNKKVDIISANDCNDVAGYERPKAIKTSTL